MKCGNLKSPFSLPRTGAGPGTPRPPPGGSFPTPSPAPAPAGRSPGCRGQGRQRWLGPGSARWSTRSPVQGSRFRAIMKKKTIALRPMFFLKKSCYLAVLHLGGTHLPWVQTCPSGQLVSVPSTHRFWHSPSTQSCHLGHTPHLSQAHTWPDLGHSSYTGAKRQNVEYGGFFRGRCCYLCYCFAAVCETLCSG